MSRHVPAGVLLAVLVLVLLSSPALAGETIDFSSSAGGTNNTKVPHAPTPSAGPGSLVLVGSGLIGLATLVRRRFQRSQ